MANYDFRNLSPIDFETLVRDLLQKELKIRLEDFSPGKDQGIDFRYSQNTRRTLIIQCKHYVESRFSVLYRNLKNELSNVRKISPQRYIIATSQGLNSQKKVSY